MTNENVKVGTMAIAKVGRNEIEVEIIAVEDGAYTVKNKSGKVFRARRVERLCPDCPAPVREVFRARRVEPMPVPETIPAESAQADTVPVAEPTAEKESENDTTNPAPESGKPDRPEKHLSLLEAAIEVLRKLPAGTALNTRDLVREATAQQLWQPTACQTPEQTLYGAIFREIKTKEQPRIVKAEAKGKFRLA